MKYIDAEKLKERVTRLIASARQNDWPIAEDYLRRVIDIINSLQQEQPEGLHFTPLNRLIQKIPSKNWNDTVNNYAKKLRDCLIKEGYLKDAGVLQGYISYMNGNNVPMATMDEQEQPEVFDTVAFQKGVQEGKRLMMEGAVEGVVCILPGSVAYVEEKNNESLKQYLLDNFKAGDEVRIIILQKEGEDD